MPGLHERFETYDAIAARHCPSAPHYYLGVIGVHPSLQGNGAGKTLLDAFCRLSADDPASGGVYLETASAGNLNFYTRNGFVLRCQGDLDGRPLWCAFLPTWLRNSRSTGPGRPSGRPA
jgi:GNAT superfamily N-acetyltransferase